MSSETSKLEWGAGLSIVLRSLPSLVITPVLAASVPTVIAYYLPRSDHAQAFLDLPAPLRAGISYATFIVIYSAFRRSQRYGDRKRFGPDVVEAPRAKTLLPWNLDLIRTMLLSHKTSYCGDSIDGLFREHGNTFNMRLLGGDQIVTNEPEHIKAVLSTDFGSFEKGLFFHESTGSVLGTGIFNSDGERWKFHRSMSRPYFSRDRIADFDLFARHSDAAISKLLSRLSEPSSPAIDFQDVVARFTLDSGTEFLFGRNIHSLDAPLPYPNSPPVDDSASFATAFGRAQEQMVVRIELAELWPYMEMFWDRTSGDMKVINAYIGPILKEKLEIKKLVNNTSSEKREDGLGQESDTLLDHLVSITDDEKLIKDEVLNILVAGRDTTAATLTFAIYLLATNPHVTAKLRAEIFDHVGSANYPTPDNFKAMKFLRAVVNETLRLFPAVPMNVRSAAKSTVLKSGGKSIYVPKGADVSYSVLHMHRRKDLWGPDAETFDPERWIDERLKKYVTPNPFIFLPFNAGPRICLGQQFAYNEMSFFLVRLFQRVESISLAPEAQPADSLPPKEWQNGLGRKAYEKVWPQSHLTIYCKGGLWVRMTEVANASG